MRFRAEEVRFVDESESLVNQMEGMSYASAMNDDIPPFGPDSSGGDFGVNMDFM